MLAWLAFAMVATFMTLIMTKRVSALAALVLVPVGFALAGGFAAELGPMMLEGIREIAPTGIMLLFAILYFGLMIDAGLFDPLVIRIVRLVGDDPLRIILGTAILALIVSLDGDGATTYMITVSAMMPLYRHLRLDTRKLACVIIMASAAANLLPWGGPTARAAGALRLDVSALWLSIAPAQLACGLWVLVAAWLLGMSERRRLAALGEQAKEPPTRDEIVSKDRARDASALRPRLFLANLALTAALLAALILNLLPLAVLFVIATAIALTLNYPALADQRRRLEAHAGNALAVAGLIFAAGIFTGILSGTGMVDAMTGAITGVIPPALGGHIAAITALISVPLTFLISNDAFYFGMLPILAETGRAWGVSPQAIAAASLVGQQVHLLSPLVPSTWLLVGLARIEFGEHLRFTLPWALASCLVMMVTAVLFGSFPL